MKVIFYNIFGLGHINPTLPLLSELTNNGVEVIYHTSPERRELVESYGAKFVNYGYDEYKASDFNPGKNFVLQTIPATVGLLPFLIEEIKRVQPDFIIYDSMAIWGHALSQIFGIPSFCTVTTFALSEEAKVETLNKHGVVIDEMNLRSIEYLKEKYNVQLSLSQTLGAYGDHNIVFTSKDFNPLMDANPATQFLYAGAMIKDSDNPQFPLIRLKEIKQTKKMITMAFGTIIIKEDPEVLFLYKSLIEAFGGDEDYHLILAVGPEENIKRLGDLPSNVMAFSHIPQVEVLKITDCFINHGGMNSVNEALHFGVPQIVIPHLHDQFGNAKRVDELKVGIEFKKDTISKEVLRKSIVTILEDEKMKYKLSQLRESFTKCEGVQGIIDYINNLVCHTEH